MAADRHTMETKYERVYALGDVVSIPLKLGKPLPKAGVFAPPASRAKRVQAASTGVAASDRSSRFFHRK